MDDDQDNIHVFKTVEALSAHRHGVYEKLPAGTMTNLTGLTDAEVDDYERPEGTPSMSQAQSIAFNAAKQAIHWAYMEGCYNGRPELINDDPLRTEALLISNRFEEIILDYIRKHP